MATMRVELVPHSPAEMPPMSTDLLAGGTWQCVSSPPERFGDPRELDDTSVGWFAASVPGTAAGALRALGDWTWGVEDEERLDGQDWWFRARFQAPEGQGPWELKLGGLATIADVWLNDRHLLHSENMFLAHSVQVPTLQRENELVIRFAALSPILARRHPRPRWKSRLVRSQSLRWYRTTLLGRIPGWSRWAAPVGPWRPVEIREIGAPAEVIERHLHSSCQGIGGTLTVRVLLRCVTPPTQVELSVGDRRTQLEITPQDGSYLASGRVELTDVERWWPHTHGSQSRYPVTLDVDGQSLSLGSVGFREVELDRSDGAFTLLVNGVEVFCRGTCWGALDAVSFVSEAEDVRASLAMARDAGMNMLRVPGYCCYEDEVFWEACDELGILVWQDCMFASVDPPEDPAFVAELERELRGVLEHIEGRPALAMICGSSETYQQASMLGLSPERWLSSLLEEKIPALIAEILPGVPYVPSSPSGGEMPFDPNSGVTHYFGVGAYMRPLVDARVANVRFAAECLSFATPPEPETIDEVFGGARVAGHDPRWKATVARDAGMSWDFEDVRDHYVHEIFGVDALDLRYADPERALDLGRAAVAEVMTVVLSDWRRRSSPCAGALVLTMRDLWPGAGWGLIDSLGRAKAPWYALSRVFAPRTVLITDEGLSGLYLHVFNDGAEAFRGRARVSVFDVNGGLVESTETPVAMSPHGVLELGAQSVLGGFRDLNNAYRFSMSTYDVVLAELEDEHGQSIGEAIHLPAGPARPSLGDIGLQADLRPGVDGDFALVLSSRLFAQYVAFDVPGFVPSDSWFHLVPGRERTITLRSRDPSRRPVGSVRALNAASAVRLREREA
jgi:beta-mannosidase